MFCIFNSCFHRLPSSFLKIAFNLIYAFIKYTTWYNWLLFWAVLGLKLRVLCLPGRHSTTWTTSSGLFALVILGIGSCIYAQACLDPPIGSSYLCLPHNWDDRCVSPHPTIGWHGISLTFCLRWAPTMTFLISASWVAEIIGMSHCAQWLLYFCICDLCLFILYSPILTNSSVSSSKVFIGSIRLFFLQR
jgi:hypothetical protein